VNEQHVAALASPFSDEAGRRLFSGSSPDPLQ
jgi:hypothetical protein